MAWLTFEALVWSFVGVCAFGAAINGVALAQPTMASKPMWRRLRLVLNVAAELAFMVCIGLILLKGAEGVIVRRDGSINFMALGIFLSALAGVWIFSAMARLSLSRRSAREEREIEERAEALVTEVRRELSAERSGQ
jgi:CHASE3 domain sensor protein